MARQDEIEQLLRDVSPLFLDIASGAQQAAAELENTEWARRYLSRTAALHQVSGTARWRMTGDGIVARQEELPEGIKLSTCDKEQNQGRYYLQAPDLAVVLTVRRKPHRDDEKPKFLQLQLEQALDAAPVAFQEQVVVYLAVPSVGNAPTFEVATRGQQTLSYRLADLVEGTVDRQAPVTVRPVPGPQAPPPKVTSTRVPGQEGEGDGSG